MILANSLATIEDPGFWRKSGQIDLDPEFESWLVENDIKYKLKIKGIPAEYHMSYRAKITFNSLADEVAFKLRWL